MQITMSRAEIRDAQRAINRLQLRDDRGRRIALRVDGIAGPKTLAALSLAAQQRQADAAMPTPRPNPSRTPPPPMAVPRPNPMRAPNRGYSLADIPGNVLPLPGGGSPIPEGNPLPMQMPGGGYGPGIAEAAPLTPPAPGMFTPPAPPGRTGAGGQGMAEAMPPAGIGMAELMRAMPPPPPGGQGMAIGQGAGPQPYQFAGPPMVPDALKTAFASVPGLMDAAQQQIAMGGPPQGLPDRGYVPPPDGFAPANDTPLPPQGPQDVGMLAEMIRGIQRQAGQGQPNITGMPDIGGMLGGIGGLIDRIAPKDNPFAAPPPRAARPRGPSFRERAAQPIPDPYAAPEIGQVINGYRYIGGDLNRRESWEKVQ